MRRRERARGARETAERTISCMPAPERRQVTERESLQVAEASRQAEWREPSFLKELFLGDFRLDLIYPYPIAEAERPEFTAFYEDLRGA